MWYLVARMDTVLSGRNNAEVIYLWIHNEMQCLNVICSIIYNI